MMLELRTFWVLVLLAIGVLGGILIQKTFSYDGEELAYYKRTYLVKAGGNIGVSQYNLRSFDGGIQWYATETDSAGALIILSTAEELFSRASK